MKRLSVIEDNKRWDDYKERKYEVCESFIQAKKKQYRV